MLAGADGDLLNAAAEAGVLESLALGMRRFGAEPAGVAAAAALWTMCAIGSPARATLIDNGTAVQVEPMKPVFEAPGTKCLRLKYDKSLSNLTFNFNLRRYTAASSLSLSPYSPCTPR